MKMPITIRPGARERYLYPAAVFIAIAAGAALRWPVRDGGLYTDDYVHHAVLDGVTAVKRSPLDLYTLVSGSEQEARALFDYGSLAWWCHPRVQLAMFRPLSSALLVFDHYVLGARPLLLHLHSLLWWVLLMVCAALLLRELVPGGIAWLALFFFALEEGQVVPLVWPANRCALVSLSLGFLGLWAHLRWRLRGGGRARFWSVALFALALLGGEWTIPVFGYLLAFELWGKPGPARERLLAVLPSAALVAAFLAVTRLLDYRTRFSNTYLSPVDDPAAFLASFATRLPALLAELAFGVPADWWHTGSPWREFFLTEDLFSRTVWHLLPDWRTWHTALGVVALLLSLAAVRWALRDHDRSQRRTMGWLLGGSLLALIPMAAPFLASRSVLPAFLGFSVFLSVLFREGFRRLFISIERDRLNPSLTALGFIIGVAFFQLLLPGWRSWRESRGFFQIHDTIARWVMKAEIDPDLETRQRVVLVNALEGQSAMFAPYLRHFYGRPMPRSWWTLSGAFRGHDLRRAAPNVLELNVLGGAMLETDFENICRSERYPFAVGDTVALDGLRVEIVQLLYGKPFVVRYTFDKPLEDPSYLFLHSTGRGLLRLKLPEVGRRMRLPRGQFPDPALFQPPD